MAAAALIAFSFSLVFKVFCSCLSPYHSGGLLIIFLMSVCPSSYILQIMAMYCWWFQLKMLEVKSKQTNKPSFCWYMKIAFHFLECLACLNSGLAKQYREWKCLRIGGLHQSRNRKYFHSVTAAQRAFFWSVHSCRTWKEAFCQARTPYWRG